MNKQHSFSTAVYQGNLSESVDQNVKLDLLQQQKMTGICTIQSSSKHYHQNTKTQFFYMLNALLATQQRCQSTGGLYPFYWPFSR